MTIEYRAPSSSPSLSLARKLTGDPNKPEYRAPNKLSCSLFGWQPADSNTHTGWVVGWVVAGRFSPYTKTKREASWQAERVVRLTHTHTQTRKQHLRSVSVFIRYREIVRFIYIISHRTA
jgi:hypothetical protein